jgi:hypothetical protein
MLTIDERNDGMFSMDGWMAGHGVTYEDTFMTATSCAACFILYMIKSYYCVIRACVLRNVMSLWDHLDGMEESILNGEHAEMRITFPPSIE